MKVRIFTSLLLSATLAAVAAAQPPGHERGGWIRPHDENRDGILAPEEISAAIGRTFAGIDANRNGVLDAGELAGVPKPPDRPPGVGPGKGPGQGGNSARFLPPFFFADKLRNEAGVPRERFTAIVGEVTRMLDKNGDGRISEGEADQGAPGREPRNGPPPPPSAQFLGAEMRFGDKPVKGRPFSAETVVEDTKLLFDGTTVKNTRIGAIHRDGVGRVRREQTLDAIAGARILAADDKPQKLVFITDFASGSQILLDENLRIARKTRLNRGGDQPPGALGPRDSGETVVGTKSIDGVNCELTRTEHEIPIGRIGNPQPLKVITERCYSAELQVVIMSSHRDPIAGLHEFRLRGIRQAEPAGDLFAIPSGYRVEN